MLQANATSINNFDAGEASQINGLRFLWLELTSVGNLHCAHCYA